MPPFQPSSKPLNEQVVTEIIKLNNTIAQIRADVTNGPSVRTWAPTLSCFTSPPTIGATSVRVGAYRQSGTEIRISQMYIKLGAGSSGGVGIFLISLPVAASAASAARLDVIGQAQLFDGSTQGCAVTVHLFTPTLAVLDYTPTIPGTLTNFAPGVPFATASGLTIWGGNWTYEAA